MTIDTWSRPTVTDICHNTDAVVKMSSTKTTNLIYVTLCYFIIVIHGQDDVTECTNSKIKECSDIVNFTLLERTNYTITKGFCGDGYLRFKSCMEPLRDLCSTAVLRLLADLISTLKYVCHPQQLVLLQNYTSCLTSTAVTSHLAQCQKVFKDGIARSNSVGDICQKMVNFLSCSRWTAWASCGKETADYVYRIQSHWVNRTTSTVGCTTTSREAPTGLLWSYVMEGLNIWSRPTSAIMQLNGDPEAWVPEFLRSGRFSRHYISSTRLARFGHLAADYWHNKLLWVDITGSTAHSAPIYFFEKESVPSTLVFGGMSKNVTAIAVDWVSQNLYWTDAGYHWLGLVPYKSGHMGHHVILFDEDLITPSGIITDPARGYLYWTDTEKGVIERSTLSGHDRRLLHGGLSVPTALAIDYGTSYLYWLGAYRHTIYTAHSDGGAVTEVRREGLTVTYNDLSVYEDYIFVTVNKADLIIYNKNNGSKLNKIGVETNLKYEETYAVTVSAPSKQQPLDNRCYYDNGGCQQICIISADSADGVVCMCTVGYHLAEDGKNCTSEMMEDDFILIADSYGKDLYMLGLDGSTIAAIPIAPDSVPQAVIFIPENETVLWYDEKTSSLKQTTIKETRTRIIHYFGSAVIRAISYDNRKNNVYFSDARSGNIKYFSLGGEHLSETTILHTDIPADIKLDVIERVIYWTEWRDMFSSPGIYSADMDNGSNKKLLISADLYYPSGLNIDFKEKKIYWCDAYTDKIEEYDLMTERRRSLVNKTGASFYSMTMDDSRYLYVSDLSSRTLGRYDLKTSTYATFGPMIFQKAVSITLYRSSLGGQGSGEAEVTSSIGHSPSYHGQSSDTSTTFHTSSSSPMMSSSSPMVSSPSYSSYIALSSSRTSTSSFPVTTSSRAMIQSSSPDVQSSRSSSTVSSLPNAQSSPLTRSSSLFSKTFTSRVTSPGSASASTSASASASSFGNTDVIYTKRTEGSRDAVTSLGSKAPDGATRRPEVARVSATDRLSNGGKMAIAMTILIIAALIITILIVIYKRKGHFADCLPRRMFGRRRMEEDTVNVSLENDIVRDIDV